MTYTPDFIYITTLNGLQDMYMVKALLDEVSITYYIKNENLIALNPFYSNTTGGLDLMVKTDEVELARRILYNAGYLADPDPTFVYNGAAWLTKTYVKFKDRPLFKRFGFFTIVVGSLVIVLGLIIGIWFYNENETAVEVDLTKGWWCVHYISNNGNEIDPNTTYKVGQIVVEMGGCKETVKMQENGTILLPGINCKRVTGKYNIADNIITINDCDTLGNIYNGSYAIIFGFNDKTVVFTRDSLEIQLRDAF